MKKDNGNVKQLLIKINYAQFEWYVCGDFKCSDFCWVCRVDTQNTLVFCACGILELMVSTRGGVPKDFLGVEDVLENRF